MERDKLLDVIQEDTSILCLIAYSCDRALADGHIETLDKLSKSWSFDYSRIGWTTGMILARDKPTSLANNLAEFSADNPSWFFVVGKVRDATNRLELFEEIHSKSLGLREQVDERIVFHDDT